MRTRTRLIVSLAITMTLLTAPLLAAAQDPAAAQISAPRAGEPLIGVVTITGTASDPSFQRYRIEFAAQDTPAEQWLLITEVAQQVNNGILAQWDTTAVPDGRYQIRLRVVLRDGTVIQVSVPNLVVSNQQPTPLPTQLIPATPLPPTPIPTEGPTPTPFIQQPATQTPAPTFAAAPVAAAPPPPRDPTPFVVVVTTLQNAFCTGVYVALGAFGLLIAYRVVYGRLRPRFRRALAEMRRGE
jgi:hypothetical protein